MKCCQRAQKDSKVVQKRFWNTVSTRKRLSFTFQTQNFNLLATIVSLIFEASKYSIFWVWKELLSDVSTIKKKWQLFWALPVGIVCGHTTFWPKASVFQRFQAFSRYFRLFQVFQCFFKVFQGFSIFLYYFHVSMILFRLGSLQSLSWLHYASY